MSSAIILSNFPSKLSDPGGLSLSIDNNHFFHLFQTNLTEFKVTMLVFHNLVRYTGMCSVSICCWHIMHKFANLANEKNNKNSWQYKLVL